MYSQLLINAGLSEIQAKTLDFLIRSGDSKAAEIAKNTSLARGVVYKALEELIALGLVEKKEKTTTVALFRAEHPSRLEEFFEEKESARRKFKHEFLQSLPDIASSFNLANNKPGVKFLEGEDGIRIALWDTLKSTTEIYTFADLKATNENLREINDEYAKRRERLGVKKKVIVSDSEENRHFFKGFDSTLTQVKFIRKEYYPFQTGMQIYANKVSYQTLAKENKIAVIIEDRNIYQMHKLLFEYIWETLP